MKRVLFVTTISGFLWQFEKNDIRILRDSGCVIHYASNFRNPVYAFDKRELRAEGIILHQITIAKNPFKLRANLKAVRQIIKIIEKNKIDIIHCHNPMGGFAGRIAAAASRNSPYVLYTAHGFHFYKGAPWLNWLTFYAAERLLARLTDQLITINSEDYKRASGFRLKKKGNVSQIPGMGVDKKRFIPHREINEQKRAELGIPLGAFHIVTAAELNKNKNQKIIIEAVSQIKRRDIFYSICGRGPEEKRLKRLIRKKGLANRVRILGYRTDMEEILQTADCFAFPSYREGFGVAAVEALLCGVPLIAADNRGTREYAIDGVNSIVCRAGSTADFRKAIQTLAGNKDKCTAMASNCRRTAEKFSLEEAEKTMREVYKRAVRV